MFNTPHSRDSVHFDSSELMQKTNLIAARGTAAVLRQVHGAA